MECFEQLSEQEKVDKLWDGTYLACIAENRLSVQLYSVGDYYVELRYDVIGHRIVSMETLRNSERLEKFLVQIDLGPKMPDNITINKFC
jgi:hypothetical protein